jgi:hypothetical protein
MEALSRDTFRERLMSRFHGPTRLLPDCYQPIEDDA